MDENQYRQESILCLRSIKHDLGCLYLLVMVALVTTALGAICTFAFGTAVMGH